MLFKYTLITSLAIGTAMSLNVFAQTESNVFRKRQEFDPGTVNCGVGDTCAESCGTGYILCSDPTTFLCYNPDLGQSCCEGGSPSSWACPQNSFCLIDDFCCPDGEDPSTCAAANSVTLPATFVATTATPAAGAATSSTYVAASTTAAVTTSAETAAATTASTTSDIFSEETPTATSPPVSTFTGAANVKSAVGSGVLYGIVALIGNLI